MQDVIKLSQQKTKKLKAVVSGHQELVAKEKRISEELPKNIYLQRELNKLKLERTRDMWLLKNDLCNLEKANSSSRNNSKNRRRCTKASPFFPRVLSLNNLS
jgi:hypothetical protein